MKRLLPYGLKGIFLVMCLFLTAVSVNAASIPYIRVRVYEGAAPVTISAEGGVEFSSGENGVRAMSQPGVKTRVTKNGTDLFLEPPAEIIPPVNGSNPNKVESEPVTVFHGSVICRPINGWLTVNKTVYRGNIQIIPIIKGYRVINELPMEEYLYGVINSEMPKTWPLEALKAQAIAARTYALQNLLRHGSDGYNLCSTTHCQAYGGVGTESPRGLEAVDSTFGLAATYQGSLISAVFHSTSGGMTEAADVVWGSVVPYLKAVESTELGSPHSQWTVSMTPAEVASKMAKAGLKVGYIIDIRPTVIGQSGRIGLATIKGTQGEVSVKGEALRSALGLKSTLFWTSIGRVKIDEPGTSASAEEKAPQGNTIEESPESPVQAVTSPPEPIILNQTEAEMSLDEAMIGISDPSIINIYKMLGVPTKFTFYGRGYGHGVGMSQYGAKTKADLGYTYDRILKHYYQGIEIKKWYGD